MQAQTWDWGRQGGAQAALWQKVRTLALDYSEPIIRLAQIPGAFIPGANKVLDKVGDLASLFSVDLNFSALDGPSAFKSFHGVPPPVTSKTGEGPVFFDGVEIMITVKHNAKGTEQVLLERIDLCPIAFVAGKDPYFSYLREGEAIIGAGFIEPMRFYVEVGAEGAGPSRRQILQGDGKKEMLIAQSDNFLDTEPAGTYNFRPQDDPLLIKFTITGTDPGYYEICLRFFYRVAARELRQYTSDIVRLYTEGY
jgi:hypothetical protein